MHSDPRPAAKSGREINHPMNRATTRAANAASAMKRATAAGLEPKPVAPGLRAWAPIEACKAFLNMEPTFSPA
jgi:hypothetical protein